MNVDLKHKRWNEIFDFIMEISKGNFIFQLSFRNMFNYFETLVMMLNHMSQEINTILHHVKPNESYPVNLHFLIKFDSELKIHHMSPKLIQTLEIRTNPRKLFIGDLISTESSKMITKNIANLKSGKNEEISFPISFLTSKKLLLAADAILYNDKHNSNDLYYLSAVKIVYKNDQLEKLIKDRNKGNIPVSPTKNQSLLLQENRNLADNIYNIIIKNLDGKLPKLSSISKELGASPSKIHKAFKFYYGKSITQIHNIKRLEQAHRLLSGTEMSVIKVAIECGYKGASHFSRKFKKQYGYSPSSIQRQKKI